MRKVYCIELDKTFNSLTEAAEFIHRNPGDLCNTLKGRRKTCGNINGVKLHWQYVEVSRTEIAKELEALQERLNKLIELDKMLLEAEKSANLLPLDE